MSSAREIEGFDDYGFAIFVPGQQPDTERCHIYRSDHCTINQRSAWQKLLDEWDESVSSGSSKLQTFIKRGVPREFRPELWKKLLEIETLRLCNRFNYKSELHAVREQLVELGVSEFGGSDGATQLAEVETEDYRIKYGQISLDGLRHIMLDLDRTYPTHRKFMNRTSDGKEGKAALFRVLATYARYNKAVEYCQGMSAIAGMFVMYLEEEDAFWCLVSLLERHKYLVGYFSEEMSRLKIHNLVFERLLYQKQPKVQKHLEALGVNTLMYTTPWFLCLFTNLPCWDTVLATWDLLLLEGHKSLFRTSLAIIECYHKEILRIHDISVVLPKLLHLPIDIVNYMKLVPRIYQTSVEDWEVNCLISVIEQEQRTLPTTPCGGRKTHPNQRGGEPVATGGGSSGKRKASMSDQADFGRDTEQRRKKTKLEQENEPLRRNSLLSRFTKIFQRNPQSSAAHTTPGGKRRRSTGRRRSLTPKLTPAKSRLSQNVKNIDRTPKHSQHYTANSTPLTSRNSPSCRSNHSNVTPRRRSNRGILSQSNAVNSSMSDSPVMRERLRRSPRLMTPSRQIADMAKSVTQLKQEATFKAFLTPVPTRHNSSEFHCSPAQFITSPDVELKPMARKQTDLEPVTEIRRRLQPTANKATNFKPVNGTSHRLEPTTRQNQEVHPPKEGSHELESVTRKKRKLKPPIELSQKLSPWTRKHQGAY